MRFRRQRAQRHRGADEALDDLRSGLDLLDVDWRSCGLDSDELAQRLRLAHAGQASKLEEGFMVVFASGPLRRADRKRVVCVMLAELPEPHAAVVGQLRDLVVAGRVQCHGLNVIEVHTADLRRHCGEAHLHHLGAETERFEDLRTAVAVDARDAHLGHDLEQPDLERLAIAGFSLRRRGAGGREGKIRMNGGCADADEASDVVNIDDITCDRDHVLGHALARLQQGFVHRAHRKRHRDRKPARSSAAIAQHDNTSGCARFAAEPDERVAQRFVVRIRGVKHRRVLEHSSQLGGAEHRRLELQQTLRSGNGRVMAAPQLAIGSALRLERAASGAKQDAERHHRLLAKGIDGGVGDLRESLPQVAIHAARRAAQGRDRDVVAHRVNRLGARLGHGRDHDLHVLGSPAVELLLRRDVLWRIDVDVVTLDRDQHAVGEESVVMPRRGALLGVAVAQDRPIACVDEEHLPRSQSAPLNHGFRSHGHHARFGCCRHEPIARALPPQWSQSVAIERRANYHAVAEGKRGGPVPRLETDRLIAIEIADGRGKVATSFPGVGHEAHERLGNLPTPLNEDLQRVVERGGV